MWEMTIRQFQDMIMLNHGIQKYGAYCMFAFKRSKYLRFIYSRVRLWQKDKVLTGAEKNIGYSTQNITYIIAGKKMCARRNYDAYVISLIGDRVWV